MKSLGLNFWIVFLPFHILALAGLFYINTYWLSLLIFWFVIGVIGNGVSAHRYFSHRQFETYAPIRYLLATLATLAATAPILYWIISHKIHHVNADKLDDPHSPNIGSAMHVFYSWTFPQGSDESMYLKKREYKKLSVALLRDPLHRFFFRYHHAIIYLFCLALVLINPIWLLMYCLAVVIDFIRLGSVNYFCHKSFGYRNHDTADQSKNNLLLGLVGMGFGWHNNHHAAPWKLVLTERWWEIDVEGYIGWIISKR